LEGFDLIVAAIALMLRRLLFFLAMARRFFLVFTILAMLLFLICSAVFFRGMGSHHLRLRQFPATIVFPNAQASGAEE
jgi:hypothetical protein